MSVSKGRVLRIPTSPVFEPLLKPTRYKGAHGGRGSAKSHFYSESAVERCVQYPGTRIVCVREVQRSLKESVKRLIEDKIQQFELGSLFGFDSIAISVHCPALIGFLVRMFNWLVPRTTKKRRRKATSLICITSSMRILSQEVTLSVTHISEAVLQATQGENS